MGQCLSLAPLSKTSLNLLTQSPFASYLTTAQLSIFALYLCERKIEKNQALFEAGEEAGSVYLIESGRYVIVRKENGQQLCSKQAGDLINCAVIPSKFNCRSQKARFDLLKKTRSLPLHPCSLICTERGRVLELSHTRVVEYMQSNPDTCQLLMPVLASPHSSLVSIPFFSDMGETLHILACYVLRYSALKSGQVLFEEGSLGQSLFVLHTGSLKAYSSNSCKGNDDIEEQTLHVFKDTHEDDRIFGEIALIMDIPRTASIRALSHCIVLEWRRDDYNSFIQAPCQQTLQLQTMIRTRTAEHFRKYKDRVPFFESIPEDKFSILASLCKIVEFQQDNIIFSEGDVGDMFYLIAWGGVRITCRNKRQLKTVHNVDEPDTFEICIMGPGSYFGEMALVQDQPRSATATAISRCIVLAISKKDFETFFFEAPEAAADFEIKLARYDVQLRSILYHPLGLKYFMQHAQREYCTESIQFWVRCRDFRHKSLDSMQKVVKTKRTAARKLKRRALDEHEKLKQEKEETKHQMDDSEDQDEFDMDESDLIDDTVYIGDQQYMEKACQLEHFNELLARHVVALCQCFGSFASPSADNSTQMEWSLTWLQVLRASFALKVHGAVDLTFLRLAPALGAKSADAVLSATIWYSLLQRRQDKFLTPLASFFLHSLTRRLVELRFHDLYADIKKCAVTKPDAVSYTEFIKLVVGKWHINIQASFIHTYFNNGPRSQLEKALDVSATEFPLLFQQLTSPLSFHMRSEKPSNLLIPAPNQFLSISMLINFVCSHLNLVLDFHHHLFTDAKDIFDQYISNTAAQQVNINGATQKAIASTIYRLHTEFHQLHDSDFQTYYSALLELNTNLFDKAEEEILSLLAADPFSRFKQSHFFQKFLESARAYTEVDDERRVKDGNKQIDNQILSGGGHKTKTARSGTVLQPHERKKTVSIVTLGVDNVANSSLEEKDTHFSGLTPRPNKRYLNIHIPSNLQLSQQLHSCLKAEDDEANTPSVQAVVRHFASTRQSVTAAEEESKEPASNTINDSQYPPLSIINCHEIALQIDTAM